MLTTSIPHNLFQQNKIGFYLAWTALNLTTLYILFGGSINLLSLFTFLVIGSIITIKLIQFAHKDYTMDFTTGKLDQNIISIFEQVIQNIKEIILYLGRSRSFEELLTIAIPLMIVLIFAKSTYLSAMLFVALNFEFGQVYLKEMKNIDLRVIVEKEQKQIENIAQQIYGMIPKYKEAKKIK